MIASRNLMAVVVVGALVLAGCSSADQGPTGETGTASTVATASPTPATPTPTPAATPTGTTVTTGGSEYGAMLFDSNGQAIYIWEVEDSSTPKCYGDCAEAWPPVITDGEPVAAGEVQAPLLGTTERADGALQVTYNDHPLYYYAHEGPGEVKCHNVATHGGLWWVVQPDGDRAP